MLLRSLDGGADSGVRGGGHVAVMWPAIQSDKFISAVQFFLVHCTTIHQKSGNVSAGGSRCWVHQNGWSSTWKAEGKKPAAAAAVHFKKLSASVPTV